MTVDRATRTLIDQLVEFGDKPLSECTLEEARERFARVAELAGPGPDMRRVEEHRAPGPDGNVPVRVLVPQQPPRGVIVYYHGGGWALGSVDAVDSLCRKLAERTACAVVLPEYRLAPEHRYPAAVDDSYAALEWTASHLGEIAQREGVPLMVAGDGAGGSLAAAVALRARDRGGPALAMQILACPITDANTGRPSYLDADNEVLLRRADVQWCWDQYVPERARRMEAEASPLCAEDLAGLPPAVIMTAEHDVLRDEGEEYARRLEAAGVAVDHRRHAGQVHGFFTFLMLPGSELGFQQVVRAVKAMLYREERRKRATSSGNDGGQR